MTTDNPDSELTDALVRFSFDGFPIRGQWVRLQQVLGDATAHRSYPAQIFTLLAQQFAAVAMLADNLKFQGAVALQSSGNGPLIRSLAECRAQHKLRGIAQLQDEFAPPADPADMRQWLGQGQLALSLIADQEDASSQLGTYQGLIELQAADLASNLEHYFSQSEQLPTRVFFAMQGANSITGLLLQRLPDPARTTSVMLDAYNEAWSTAMTLAETVQAEELSQLPVQGLLHRLFNEFAVRLQPAKPLHHECTCNRQKSDRTLGLLPADELAQMLDEQQQITVDCEICGARYSYDAVDVQALGSLTATPDDPPIH